MVHFADKNTANEVVKPDIKVSGVLSLINRTLIVSDARNPVNTSDEKIQRSDRDGDGIDLDIKTGSATQHSWRTWDESVYSFAARKIKGSELDKAPTLYGDPKTMDASVSGNEIVPATIKIIISASDENSNTQSEKTTLRP